MSRFPEASSAIAKTLTRGMPRQSAWLVKVASLRSRGGLACVFFITFSVKQGYGAWRFRHPFQGSRNPQKKPRENHQNSGWPEGSRAVVLNRSFESIGNENRRGRGRGVLRPGKMLKLFGKLACLASTPPWRGQAREHGPIMISSDARVSLDQNGAVFLNTRRGVVFTANRMGARIWQGLLDRESLESIGAGISRETGAAPDQARQDAAEFVTQLESQGFLSRQIGN